MNITGHTSRNLPIKPLPVTPEDIAAHARIERAMHLIREAQAAGAAELRKTPNLAVRGALIWHLDTLLDLANVLEIKR